MDAWAIIAMVGGAFAIGLVGTWLTTPRQGESYAGWKRKASFVSLVLPSAAVPVLLVISTIAYFHPLYEIDDASLRGGWHALLGVLWLCGHFATGVLPLCGLVLALLGNGRPRLAGAMWSAAVFLLFFLSLIVSVNSFH
jgi:hypothetical protein